MPLLPEGMYDARVLAVAESTYGMNMPGEIWIDWIRSHVPLSLIGLRAVEVGIVLQSTKCDCGNWNDGHVSR